MARLDYVVKRAYKCTVCGFVAYSLSAIRGHVWSNHGTFKCIRRIR